MRKAAVFGLVFFVIDASWVWDRLREQKFVTGRLWRLIKCSLEGENNGIVPQYYIGDAHGAMIPNEACSTGYWAIKF